MANLHLGDVTDIDRHAILFLEHDGAQVVEILHQADTADQVLLGILRQHATAGVGVIAADRQIDVGDAQAEMAQLVGVDQDLVLLCISALRVDLGDPRDRAQQRPRHPVLGDPALHQLFFAQGAVTVVGAVQRVLIDLAEARRNRAEHRRDALRQARTHFKQSLHDQLAGKIDIGLVVEDQRDQRQPRLVERTHFLQPGQAGHRDLERHRGETLDFLRRAARRLGGDLDLDVGHIGKGVDRKLAGRIESEEEQDGRNDRDDQALLERPANKRLDHLPSICLRLRSLLRWKAPSTTTCSSPFKPDRTTRCPDCSGPSLTLTSRKASEPSAMKT